MAVSKKAIMSFLIAGFLSVGIAVLAYTGEAAYAFHPSIAALVFTAIFLTLLLIIFFLFSLAPSFKYTKSAKNLEYAPPDELESLEALMAVEELKADRSETVISAGTQKKGKGLLAVTMSLPTVETIEEISHVSELPDTVETASPYSTMYSSAMQPFILFPGNPELLPRAENNVSGDVIFEQNGIHYVNCNAFEHAKKPDDQINKNFAELVKSVTQT